MAKYKVEFEEDRWKQIIGFLQDYMTRLLNEMEKIQEEKSKREEEWAIASYENMLKGYSDAVNVIQGQIGNIKQELKQQGLKLPETEHVK